MAVFTITIDTEENTLEVLQNGTALQDVNNVHISKYQGYDGDQCNIEVSSSTKDGDISKTVTLYASKRAAVEAFLIKNI
jgi:hypothetical protein